MKGIIVCLILTMLLISSSVAVQYKKTAGPWTVEFNGSAGYNTRNHYEPPTQEGFSWWLMYLIDPQKHEVGWFVFRSYSNPQKATEDSMDKMLDWAMDIFKVTSPDKTTMTVDGTEGRKAEAYSSVFNRKWRGVIYPYRPTFDNFTNSNMTFHFVGYNGLQDLPEFDSIVSSMKVTNATHM